jgi:predicted ATPase/DNA-binding CsgD family transcriptional regulator
MSEQPVIRESESRLRARAPLPHPVDSLIGREREAAALQDLLLRPDVRLLTLTGPGGVGKTRLAIEAARRAASDFDGVGYVGLAAIRDPDLVLPTIAQALAPREANPYLPADRLRTLLTDRHFLLVLDNFEQILATAPRIARLLSEHAQLHVLVTSRAMLHLSGERAFPVLPLGLPDGSPAAAEEALAAPAVRLFADRAEASDPTFTIDGTNAAAVAEICRRLDGLPLAIELAAARIRSLSPAALLARLEPRLTLLTGGPRDQPARLQTMRDAIAWSDDLLDDRERALFEAAAVFAGGFTLEAAEYIAPPPYPPIPLSPSSDTLDLVASLVAKSLVRYEGDVAGEPRYGMLETIREYGLERLAASGREAEVRSRHADWCLAIAERAAPNVKGPDAAIWLEQLEREHANLRAALSWLEKQRDGRRLTQLAGALWSFWQEHAHYDEGRRWLETALDLGQSAPADRLRALTGAGTMAWYQTDVTQAMCWHEQALTLARETGDRRIEALSLSNLGALTVELGDHDRAASLFEASLVISRAIGDADATVSAQKNLAYAMWLRGEAGTAVDLLMEALALAREHGIAWILPSMHTVLGFASTDLGDYERAATFLHESLLLGRARGNLTDLIDATEGLAKLAAATGQMRQAASLFGAAAARRDEGGIAMVPLELKYFEPIMNDVRDALGADAYTTAWTQGRSLSPDETIAAALAIDAAPAACASPGSARTSAEHDLTRRELEVLKLIVAGHINREVSELLFISPATTARHIANIYRKLGVDSRAKLTAYALRHGLV